MQFSAGMQKTYKYYTVILALLAGLMLYFPVRAQFNKDNKSSAELLLEKAFRQQEKGNLTKAMDIASQAANRAKQEMEIQPDSASRMTSKRVVAESYILISKGIEALGADRKGGLLDSNITWLTSRIREFRAIKNYPVFAGDLYFTMAEKYLLWAPDFLPSLSQKQASDSASRYLLLAWKDYQAFQKTGSEAYGKLLNDLSKLAYKNQNYQAAEDYALEWVIWLEQTGKNPDPSSGIWLAQCEFFNKHSDLAFKHINDGLNLAVTQKNPIAYAEGTRTYACMAYAERGTSEAAVVYGILIPGLSAAVSEEGQAALNARLMLLAGITDLIEIDPSALDSLRELARQLEKNIIPDLALLASPWPEFYFRIDQCRLALLSGDSAMATNQLGDLEKRLSFLAPQYPEVSTHDLKSELLLMRASIMLSEKRNNDALHLLKDYKNTKKHHPSYDDIQPESMLNDRYLIREEMVNHYNLFCK